MIKIFKAGVLECWSIVEDPGFFRGSIETIVLKFQKVLLGPSLQYSITPIINNVPWTSDNPIDKETQFKAVHSITTKVDIFWRLKNKSTSQPPDIKPLFSYGYPTSIQSVSFLDFPPSRHSTKKTSFPPCLDPYGSLRSRGL